MSLLRSLAARPGQALSRDGPGPLLPGESSEGHAVEVAMGRLRTALGDPGPMTMQKWAPWRPPVHDHG